MRWMTPRWQPQLLKHLVKISHLRPDRIAYDSSNVTAGNLEAQQYFTCREEIFDTYPDHWCRTGRDAIAATKTQLAVLREEPQGYHRGHWKRQRERERRKSGERYIYKQEVNWGKPLSGPWNPNVQKWQRTAKTKVIIVSHKCLICYDTLIPCGWHLLAYIHIKWCFITSQHAG